MLGSRPVPVRFRRRFSLNGQIMSLTDELHLEGDVCFTALAVGGEFFVRYVPQSRYFQSQEFDVQGMCLSEADLQILRRCRVLSFARYLDTTTGRFEAAMVESIDV